MLGGLAAAFACGSDLLAALADLSAACFSLPSSPPWGAALDAALLFAARVGGAAFGAALAAGLMQVGLSARGLRPSLKRLDPIRGMGRLFSRQRLFDLGLLVAQLACLLGIGAAAGMPLVRVCLQAARQGDLAAPSLAIGSQLAALAWPLAIAAAAWAGLDLRVQRRRFLRRMRMSDEERKKESKETEGDPALKSERRRRHRQVLEGGLAGMRRASVLVVNPTHLAVGLRYLPAEDSAPVVVARGSGELAQRLRREAMRLGVPVIQHVPLARALFASAEPGEEIPEQLYEAAAEVIRCLQGLQGGS